ncbi:unnamed protein product [Cylicocyclus nassatus]|uniref:Uncharacterized protein n=1 Tax=Cylicocyclus nassatus TaxID=53992 RepID=A0AA36MGH2_CYLNA|nr:unnamed protein product [Cylicocyclus nassatus]
MHCSDEEEVTTRPGFLTAVAMQAVASWLSIIVCIIVARRSRNLLFHINCKVLVLAMVLLFIVHSLILGFLQTLQIVRYFTMSDHCQAGISPLLCFCLRAPSNTCMVSFVLFQFMVVAERALALWKHRSYASWGPHFGYVASAFCLVASAAAVFWMMENADLEEKQPFCSAATSRTRQRVQRIFFAMSAICIANLAGLLILTTLNRIAVRRHQQKKEERRFERSRSDIYIASQYSNGRDL